VVNSAPDDVQLEQLLTQLLRMVSPGLRAERLSKGSGGTADRLPGELAEPGAQAIMTGSDSPAAAGPPKDYGVPGPAGSAWAGAGADGIDAGSRGIDSGQPLAQLPSISSSEARALIELMSARGIAQGELAALLGLDKSTVSRLATGLERKGWIRRGRDEDNQRYVRLYLTAHGGEVAARVWQAWQSRRARILAVLSPDERAGLSAGLRGLIRGLAAEGLLDEATGNRSQAASGS
jgi:DNA-binding MarR family transcriptional regulator